MCNAHIPSNPTTTDLRKAAEATLSAAADLLLCLEQHGIDPHPISGWPEGDVEIPVRSAGLQEIVRRIYHTGEHALVLKDALVQKEEREEADIADLIDYFTAVNRVTA